MANTAVVFARKAAAAASTLLPFVIVLATEPVATVHRGIHLAPPPHRPSVLSRAIIISVFARDETFRTSSTRACIHFTSLRLTSSDPARPEAHAQPLRALELQREVRGLTGRNTRAPAHLRAGGEEAGTGRREEAKPRVEELVRRECVHRGEQI